MYERLRDPQSVMGYWESESESENLNLSIESEFSILNLNFFLYTYNIRNERLRDFNLFLNLKEFKSMKKEREGDSLEGS